jgi:ATP-dependent DNA helicase UvrD/PcrA
MAIALDDLNPPQAEAVAHVDGPLIVFAGAGSGKTRVITYRIANMIARHGVPPYRVLAVTFTNKAAGEMKHRLERMLGAQIVRELWIGTFHAVCVRLIRRYHEAMTIGRNFVIYDESDQRALMKRVVEELGLDDRRYPPGKVLARIEREKQEARGPAEMIVRGYFDEITQRCYELYEKRLAAANACDFADLLLHVLRLAEDEKSDSARHLRERFSHVLVDEFQDTNLVQYRLVKALGGTTRNICVVGDDDQSIYRWRGADVRNIRGFTRDFPEARLVKLEQNYRSSQNVVAAALGVIKPARDRQPKELWTGNPAGEPVRVVHSANERDEAAFVVGALQNHLEAGVSPRDAAIFYRVHAQSRVLEEAMRAENIPYQIVGGLKFFDRAEVKDLLAYLRVVVNSKSDVDLVRIINRPARKIGGKTVDKLTEIARQRGTSLYDAIPETAAGLGPAAKKSMEDLHQLLAEYTKAAATASPRELAEDLVARTGYGAWLEAQDSVEADARLDNIKELLGSLSDYEEERALAGEETSLEDYLTRITLVADADTLEDVPRVPMMTVHAAKGLEFDVVFLTGLEERLFPLLRQEPGEAEDLEEERRLAYVAVTRARHHLYATFTNTRTIYGQLRYNQPSRFLADIPAGAQARVATEALTSISRSYTMGTPVTIRDFVRAGASRVEPQREIEPLPAPGERYVERDDDVPMYDDDDAVEPAAVRIGARVRHPKFGVGVVRSIDAGVDPTATVKFQGTEPKRIKLRFLLRA